MSDPGKPLRVLLIEDSENDAVLLLRELRRGGYEPSCRRVDTPEDMEAALRDADDRGEPWEIIISDYYMPRFRGPDALALVRRLGYDTPFIVVSGKVGEDLAVEIMRAGAQDYVTKENMVRLNPAIERELREARVRLERTQTQEALDRSEERFRRIVEQAADAMFVHDLEGRFVDVNRQARESLGYTREELLVLSVPDVEMDYEPGSLKKLWKQVSSGAQRTLDGVHRRKDGTTFPVEIRLGMFESEGTPLMLATARDVTERKKAEDELRESEGRFRATFEQAAVGILQVGLDAAWIRVNDRFCEIVGYSPEELREISVFDLILPEDFDADFDRGTRMLAGELRDYSEEKCIAGKDGRRIWINLTVSLVYDAPDKPGYFIAIIEDISQRRRAEEDLRLRDRAIAASSNGIVISDPNQPDDPIIYVNASFERLTGYTPEEVIGRNCRFLQGEDRDQPALEELRAALREERACTAVLRNYKKDGSLFWNELSVSPVRDEQGRLTHFIGVQEDVSDRLRTEEALRESERRFRALVQNASDIIIVLDPDGTIRYESPALERILGYRPEERIGKKVSDLIHPDDLAHVSRALMEYIEDPGTHQTVEYRVCARDGEWHYFEGVGNNLIDDPSVRGIVVNARDITDRKRAEREVRESEEKYRTLFETMTQGIVYQDAEGRIISANPAAEKILGQTLEQMQGKTPQDPRWRTIREDHSDFPGEEHPAMIALRTGEKVENVVMGVFVPERGEYRWVNVNAVPQFRPGEDRPYQAYSIFEDITARKQAEEELQWSERSLSEAQRLAHLGNWHYDVARDRAYWSDELYRIFGLAHQQFVPTYRTFLDYVHHDDKRLVRGAVRAAWRGVDRSSVEYRIVRPDGEVRFVNTRYESVRDSSGRPVQLVGTSQDITYRKRVEETLRMSETRFRTIIEQSPLSVQILAPDGRTLRVNRAWEELWGATLEDLGDYNLLEDQQLVDKDIMPYILRGFAGEPTKIPAVVYDPDESIPDLSSYEEPRRWVQAFIYPVKDESGDIREVTLIHEDVTDRKRAEQALKESEERYRIVAETASDGIVMIDEDSRILFVNSALADIFGYDSDEELVGRSLTMLMPEYLRQVHEASLKRYMDTGERHLDWDAIELPGLHKSGEEIPLEVSFGEFYKEGRRFFTGFIRDITERKRAEERIRESERRYRAVVEQATEGILLVDVDSKRILEANAAYHDLLGYSFEEILELTLYDVVPYSRHAMDCYVERVLEENSYVSGERRHRRKDGSLVDVEVSANIISYGGREVMCILVRDITERKLADEEIRSHARQQAAVADLSRLALTETDLTTLMNEAVEAVSRTLEVEYCKVLELLPDGEELLLRAGVGWREGMVGHATVGAHLDSQAGYTLVSDEPVVSEDLGSETRFSGPPLLHGHGVVSGMSTVIRGYDRPYGVLGAHTTRRRSFSEDDVNFLRAVANVLAAAIERQRAEAGLRESEERFRATFEQAAVGVAHVGFGGDWLRVNDRLCEIVGYTREELLGGMTFQDITYPDDLQSDLDLYHALIAGEISTYDIEKRYFRKDGSVVWINLTVSAATGREGTPEYAIAVIEDITARKRDEAELERQAELIDLSHDAIVVRGTDGTIFSWNRGAEEVYGWSKEEAVGADMNELLQVEFLPSREDVEATLQLGGRWEGELRCTRRDGEVIEIESRQVIIGEAGARMVLEINRDITGRKRNEADLARLATFPELNPAPIIETDVAGNTTYLNPAADAWFSELADQGSRHPLLADLEQVEAEIRGSGGRPLNREVRVGENFYLQTISRLPESGLLRIYATDVTERRRAEDGLRFLAGASEALSASLDYHETLASVARLAVPALADWCAIDVVEDGSINRLAVVHEDPEKLDLAHKLRESYPPDPESQYGAPRTLREGRSVLVPEVSESLLREAARDEEHLEILKGLGLKSYMAVPLIVRGRTLGMITLASDESGPIYGEADLKLAEDLARRAAVAVDNARLYEEAQRELSEREVAEVALRESRQRYRTFIAQSTEGIMRFELEEPISLDGTEDEQIEHFYRYGYLAECNDAMARMYGYESAQDIIGARAEDMLPRSVPQNVEFLRAGIRNGYRVVDAESQEFDRWGNRKYFLNNLTGIIEDGQVVRAWGTQRDITEQRQAEEALRQSEELYRTVVEQAAENIFVVDTETKRILETNDAFRDSLGYEEEEIERLTLYDIVAHDRESVDRNTRRIVEEGRHSLGERQYRRRDGSLVEVEVNVSLVSLNDRQAMCIVAHDVTERKQAEQALRRSEELYRAVVEQAGEGIFLFDTKTKQIVETNSAFQRMLGYTSEELGRMSVYDLIPNNPETVDQNVRRALEQRSIMVGERNYLRKDGSTVDVEVSGSVIYYRGQEVLCAVARDVTERKRNEAALREVREAERNRIARDLHDDILQDIVYALQEANILQTLSGGGETSEELGEISDALRRSVEGLRETIFNLRLEDNLKQSFAFSLRSLVELHRRMSRKRYALELEVEEGFPEQVSYEAGRELIRVLQESLNNARRHANPRHVRVRLGVEGGEVWAAVEDDGGGFDAGTFTGGVGQHSMRQRVAKLGGNLRVESEPGAGTRVSLRVPYSRLVDE